MEGFKDTTKTHYIAGKSAQGGRAGAAEAGRIMAAFKRGEPIKDRK